MFLHFRTLRPCPFTFRPNIKWVARTHDGLYPCGKFGDCNLSCFGSIVRKTDTQTDVDERYTYATLVGVSEPKETNYYYSDSY